MTFRIRCAVAAFVCWLGAGLPVFAQGEVAVTIVPLHSLVAAVMEGAGEPVLIVPQNASPHTFALKPSQALSLRNADIVFWAGPGVETFMTDIVADLKARSTVVTLAEAAGVERLPVRGGGAFADHDHGHDGHDHTDAPYDAHVWLDPQNAITMVGAIVAVLGEKRPGEKSLYIQNGEKLVLAIKTQQGEIEARLAPLASRRFVLFHDATQYFERRFGLSAAGTMTVHPEVAPGAKTLSSLHALVEAHDAVCVFAEPQFDRRLTDTVVEGTGAKVGIIDPEGALLTPGPAAYLALLNDLSAAFEACLSP